jgi:hypothetical protein
MGEGGVVVANVNEQKIKICVHNNNLLFIALSKNLMYSIEVFEFIFDSARTEVHCHFHKLPYFLIYTK